MGGPHRRYDPRTRFIGMSGGLRQQVGAAGQDPLVGEGQGEARELLGTEPGRTAQLAAQDVLLDLDVIGEISERPASLCARRADSDSDEMLTVGSRQLGLLIMVGGQPIGTSAVPGQAVFSQVSVGRVARIGARRTVQVQRLGDPGHSCATSPPSDSD